MVIEINVKFAKKKVEIGIRKNCMINKIKKKTGKK